ncbi:synaptotagmin-16 isoform X2 [Phyllopteryx taeniolatus]|uniref:synaptotagmin-16 isoform X2 n=1 Tax=Phyllopteryx taeniolatus TaxID=161469 RepID=UPI002AD4507F|nr:synaptotagmin-16 isoform X2 [Phyllopteryx taeniolatus]
MSAAPNSTAPSSDVEITPEAVGFLSAVGVFIAALALVFLFVNKMLCFSKVGGAPCLERRRRSPGVRRGLVDSGDQSSSDSDNQLMKHFEISVSRSKGRRPAAASGRRDLFAGERTTADDGAESSQREAVTEATGQRHRLDETRGAPEGPPPQQPHSLAAVEESPAPSDAKPPITDNNSEDLEAGCGQTADGSAAWKPQEPRTPNDVTPSPAGSSPRRPLSKCCDLLVSLEYRAAAEKLLVTVVSARDLPDRRRSGMDAWQVHVVLLPTKKQRHKTSLRRPAGAEGPASLGFGQTFALTRVEASRLPAAALRFRMYALEGRMSRQRMMGEKLLPLAGVDRAGGTADIRLVLEPRHNTKSVDSELSLAGDSASSTQSLTHGGAPELLMGLSYSATTGRMSVEVIKGSHFRNMAANRPPDTFARLTLLNSVGQEISRCKTSVRRAQPNPVYRETFAFQVPLFQLSDVTLMASVYGRRGLKRKEMIGWAALGQNSSGEEERLHWRDAKDARGAQVCRWHVLLDA